MESTAEMSYELFIRRSFNVSRGRKFGADANLFVELTTKEDASNILRLKIHLENAIHASLDKDVNEEEQQNLENLLISLNEVNDAKGLEEISRRGVEITQRHLHDTI